MKTNHSTAKIEAKTRLKKMLPRGSKVYTVLRHRSRSGMSRTIQLIGFDKKDGRQLQYGYNAAILLGWRYDRDADGVKVSGCGMDMGFHLVYELSSALYGDGYAIKGEWI